MSKRYTDEDKHEVLQKLLANRNNVQRTALETGVPERTLRAWHNKLRIEQLLPSTPRRQQQEQEAGEQPPEFKEDVDAFRYLREQIKAEMVSIITSLKEDLSYATPYQRVLILSQLLDRIGKIDAYIPTVDTGPRRTIIQYQQEGKIYNTPPWLREYEELFDPMSDETPPWDREENKRNVRDPMAIAYISHRSQGVIHHTMTYSEFVNDFRQRNGLPPLPPLTDIQKAKMEREQNEEKPTEE